MHLKTLVLLLGVSVGIVVGELGLYSSPVAIASLCIFLVQIIFLGSVKILYAGQIQREGRPSLFIIPVLSSIFFAALSLGILRVQLEENKNALTCITSCTFSGVVTRTPKIQDEFQKIIVRPHDENVYDVEVRAPLYPRFRIGEQITLTGVSHLVRNKAVTPGEKNFDYVSFLQTHNIGSQMYYPKIALNENQEEEGRYAYTLGRLREKYVEVLHAYVDEPGASLASGMLFGTDSFSKEISTAFKVAGLSHIIVLSGFNISILISVVMVLTLYLPLTLRVLVSTFSISFFILMVGGEVSIVRATIMAFFSLLALFFGRQYIARQALLLSFLCIVLYQPRHLIFDASLHLSFLATAGIIYMNDSIMVLFSKVTSDSLKGVFVTTVSAYVATLPYLMWSFGTTSLYALVANSLVLPLVPWTMLLSFLVVVFSYISPVLASVLGYLTTLLCSYSVTVAQLVSTLPYASISGSISFTVMLFMYLGIVFMLYRFTGVKKNETSLTKSNEVLSGIISY